MDKEKIPFDIAKLISSKILGSISDEDNELLQKWLNESEDNQLLFNYICSKENLEKKKAIFEQFNNKKGWNRFSDVVDIHNKRRFHWAKYLEYAALIAAVFSVGYFLYSRDNHEVKTEILGGGHKAILTLSDGSNIQLEEGVELKIESEDTSLYINSNDSILTYPKTTGTEIAQNNTIYVPRLGEYVVQLSDGTKVYLNSETTLRYPVAFNGNEREVFLEGGEAYFDVATDSLHPFIVKLDNYSVQVYGTSFNISSYKDNDFNEVTLVSGSVVVAQNNGKKYSLKPGDQAYSKNNVDMEIRQVNTQIYTSWKDGKFMFTDNSLEDIFKQVCRWYDVSVVFSSDDIRRRRFTGVVIKSMPLDDLLKIIEHADKLKIERRGGVVTISEQ